MGPLGLLMQGEFALFAQLAIAIVIALSLHEFGHAYVADRQGDMTARLAGRLTINPVKHLDPIGSLFFLLAGFGWGKPVPFSPSALRNKRFGAAYVALAGPGMNILLALLAAGILRGTRDSATSSGVLTLLYFLDYFIYINVLLAVFNMIPIPPLDGSRVLSAALPPSKQHIVYFLDRWGFLILIVLVFTVLRFVLSPVTAFVQGLIYRLFGL